jgi:hypothetical protein
MDRPVKQQSQPALPPSRFGPVKRAQGERYVLTTLIALAASVIITRVYLEWAGYPQIGSGNLHIAHVLWGGLLLYVAALLPLVVLNRGALTWSAILNGVGVGLFIDEVGKFITRDVDYFYPPAAPIIYAFFLLSVLFYLFVRRPARHDARAELYRAVEELPALVDGVLLEQERQELIKRLSYAQQSREPQLAALAAQLQMYVETEHKRLAVGAPGVLHLFQRTVMRWGQMLGQLRHRRLILWLLGLQSVLAVIALALLLVMLLAPTLMTQPLGQFLVSTNELRSVADLPWFLTRFGLQLVIGLMVGIAFVLLWRGREETALKLAIFSLTLSLTTVVLLTFYLNQFSAISSALFQFVLLLFFGAYRHWYLNPTTSTNPSSE